MIVGIGVDIVDVGRLWAALERTPALAPRLFAESERGGRPESLAASFAAKEAVAKALGAPPGLHWTDVSRVPGPRWPARAAGHRHGGRAGPAARGALLASVAQS